MKRRVFIGCGFAAMLAKPVAHSRQIPASGYSTIEVDDVIFRWRVVDGALYCQLTAPTQGWLAAGFNDRSGLADTWFAIGHVAGAGAVVEEHIAKPPNHRTVQSLRLPESILESDGAYSAGLSTLNFTVAQEVFSERRIELKPGNVVHLMLAWSRESDFDHHSAWRKHVTITL